MSLARAAGDRGAARHRGSRRLHRLRQRFRVRRFAPSTSSFMPAPSRSRSAWRSPKAWRAGGRSSSVPLAAPPRSCRPASTARHSLPAMPARSLACSKQLVANADLRLTLGRAGRSTAERSFGRARLAGEHHAEPTSESLPEAGLRVLHVHSGNLYGGVETFLTTLARDAAAAPQMQSSFALCFDGRLSADLTANAHPPSMLGAVRLSRPWTVLASATSAGASSGGENVRRRRLPSGVAARDLRSGYPSRRAAARLLAAHRAVTAGTGSIAGRALRRRISSSPTVSSPPATSKVGFPAHRSRSSTTRSSLAQSNADIDASRAASPLARHSDGRRGDRPGRQARAVEGISRNARGPWPACATSRAGPTGSSAGHNAPDEETYFAELQALAQASSELTDRVRFAGQRSDVSALLQAADIYCQPNTSPEPFGITFVEAQAAGLPIVSSAAGGALEIVDDDCGRLVACRQTSTQPPRRFAS